MAFTMQLAMLHRKRFVVRLWSCSRNTMFENPKKVSFSENFCPLCLEKFFVVYWSLWIIKHMRAREFYVVIRLRYQVLGINIMLLCRTRREQMCHFRWYSFIRLLTSSNHWTFWCWKRHNNSQIERIISHVASVPLLLDSITDYFPKNKKKSSDSK